MSPLTRPHNGRTASLLSLLLALALAVTLPLVARATAQDLPTITVTNGPDGSTLDVNGRPLMVNGMNWGYMPIGENYTYSLWNQPEDIIQAALDQEMPLLQAMGVNAIRQYVGIPPRWVRYIYEKYGIWTVLNDFIGRYGMTIEGVWHPVTDYSDPKVRSILKQQMHKTVAEFKDTPGVLIWLLGNENNYGLSWSSFEIENLPKDERNTARARYLYSLMGEIIRDVKSIDKARPVAIANGDVQYIDLIAEECTGLDIFGTNVYRGASARDLFQVVKNKLGVPVMFTEFGCDAFNAATMREDQAMQARYLLAQWQEIYAQTAGKGRVGNAIGGLIFQWSDGWWKYKQDANLDIHDTHASWANAGYPDDLLPGENNMNEEWWGICAKGTSDARGLYQVYPRAAYYALRDAFRLNPYGHDTDLKSIDQWFGRIQPMAAVLEARGDAAALQTDTLSKVRLAGLRMEFETYSTGGKNISTPDNDHPQTDAYPSFLGFDHGESYYADFEAKPSDAVQARLSVNMLGHVAANPIDEIFYENRGRPQVIYDGEGNEVTIPQGNRVQVYQGSLNWDDHWFTLDAFYRVGHLHWQYEGDFFGLYRDAYYGENIDIYNGEAPLGFEIAGKKSLNGLKMAFGPQLWWGANPAVFLKYNRRFAGADWTAVFQNDFEQRNEAVSSVAIPVRTNRKASLQMKTRHWGLNWELGALWAGNPRVGETFQLMDEDLVNQGGPYDPADVKQDRITSDDTWGFRAKATWEKGKWHWYGQGAYMGLVADGGPTSIPTFTGWQLRDSGSGNQINALTGLAYNVGDWQIGPNLLWQKPIVGPMPNNGDLVGTAGRTRNPIDDAFAVLGNRETRGAELLLTYDPTPATWMWAWDSDRREDAKLAASLGLTLKEHPTTADAALFVADTGAVYAFPGGTPARSFGDLWDVHARVVNRVSGSARMVSNIVFGTAEPRGDNDRLVRRFSVDSRVVWPAIALAWHVKFNDYGPYDYHHDHNLTYPLQLMGDLSYSLGRPRWFGKPQTRLGVRAVYRSLDRYSNRYQPDGVTAPVTGYYPEGLDKGSEWEIRTYLHLAM